MSYDARCALEDIGAPSVPDLIVALVDENPVVIDKASKTLWRILEKCDDTEKLDLFDEKLAEGCARLKDKLVDSENIGAQIWILKLAKVVAAKKNSLAPRRDILLDGKPMPPKTKIGDRHSMRRVGTC